MESDIKAAIHIMREWLRHAEDLGANVRTAMTAVLDYTTEAERVRGETSTDLGRLIQPSDQGE